MKTLLFLFILCLQILNLYAQESKIPNEKGKHAIGIQLMPIVESIFLPDCYIPNLNYRYRVKEKVQFSDPFYIAIQHKIVDKMIIYTIIF
jgi:hypothetical protein